MGESTRGRPLNIAREEAVYGGKSTSRAFSTLGLVSTSLYRCHRLSLFTAFCLVAYKVLSDVVTARKRDAENQGTRNDPSKREETLPPMVLYERQCY